MTRPSPPVQIDRRNWGRLAEGKELEEITLTAFDGVAVSVLTYGATLNSLSSPDSEGRTDDILLGPADPRDHVLRRDFFGSTVGRMANRIAFSCFDLDGQHYELDANEAPHHLHGGARDSTARPGA